MVDRYTKRLHGLWEVEAGMFDGLLFGEGLFCYPMKPSGLQNSTLWNLTCFVKNMFLTGAILVFDVGRETGLRFLRAFCWCVLWNKE